MGIVTTYLREIILQMFIFIAIFAEAFPFIGAFVPGGAILLFFVGIFSRLGYLNLWISLVVCFLASLLVDSYGFYLGKRRGNEMISKCLKYVPIKEGFLHKIGDLVIKHPTKILIMGKFNPVTRSIAPFMAGMKGMNRKKFEILNWLNSFLLVIFFVLLGYFIGHGVNTIKFIQNWVIVLTILLFILLYCVYLFYENIKNFKGHLVRMINKIIGIVK